MTRSAALERYWDSLPDECVCGAPSEQVHHIIHVNGQRITKDDWLVVKLCSRCHSSLHSLGGDDKFYRATDWNVVHIAVLNRHNHEVYHLRRAA